MTTQQLAILVSFLSAAIATTALGWNIYRDVVLKGRIRVSLAVGDQYLEGRKQPAVVVVTVVNFGPGPVHIEGFTVADTSIWRSLRRDTKFWLPRPQFESAPFGKLPQVLTAGQRALLTFAYEGSESFLADKHARFGLNDTFGRTHLASKRDHVRARRRHRDDFGAA